jgi:hypothetical protein
MEDTESKFYEESSLIGECYNKCPVECVEVKYDLTVSASSFPTEWYADVLTNNSQFNVVTNMFFSGSDYTGDLIMLA